MHQPTVVQRVRDLHARGLSDAAVASTLDLPRTTVRDIRRRPVGKPCPRCLQRMTRLCFDDPDYAELLGLYLGDGHILRVGRTHRLRLSLDARYPGIVDDAHALLGRCFPDNAVGEAVRDGGSCRIVSVNHRHLPCLFPQHAPGTRKHEREIRLEPWQHAAVEAAPWHFLRGCIRSDGCVFVNRTGRYEYLSYDFSNRSTDVLDLFSETCHRLGVEHRRYDRCIRIYRRSSVARVLEHVGVKA